MTIFKSNGDRVPAVIESYADEVRKGGMDRREFLAMASAMGASTAFAYSMIGSSPAQAAALE
ncbi:twin-arginine translocation signal domain-containing protein, partial [Mesorhizobium sp. M7A.F.Ca.CA.002.05.1.1]